MPNIQVKLRRGTTAQHGSFTGAEGEVTVDTDKDTVVVHDGSTAGGHELRKKSDTIAGSEIDNDAVDTAQIAANAVTSTEIANDAVTTDKINLRAVTFPKIQLMANMNVVGNLSGSTASPTSVSVLDEDAMTSNSATALATQQSIKAYVDNQISQVSTQVSKYTSTWFNNATGLANGGTYSFSHDLGITDILVQVYVSDNSSGTNPQLVSYLSHAPGSVQTYGATITNITSNVIDVQLGSYGYLDISNVGYQTLTTFVGKYIKVVAIG